LPNVCCACLIFFAKQKTSADGSLSNLANQVANTDANNVLPQSRPVLILNSLKNLSHIYRSSE